MNRLFYSLIFLLLFLYCSEKEQINVESKQSSRILIDTSPFVGYWFLDIYGLEETVPRETLYKYGLVYEITSQSVIRPIRFNSNTGDFEYFLEPLDTVKIYKDSLQFQINNCDYHFTFGSIRHHELLAYEFDKDVMTVEQFIFDNRSSSTKSFYKIDELPAGEIDPSNFSFNYEFNTEILGIDGTENSWEQQNVWGSYERHLLVDTSGYLEVNFSIAFDQCFFENYEETPVTIELHIHNYEGIGSYPLFQDEKLERYEQHIISYFPSDVGFEFPVESGELTISYDSDSLLIGSFEAFSISEVGDTLVTVTDGSFELLKQ